ncbi:hypothetical protein DVX06_02300 [Enterococcus faecium]|nr:hypothetical protein DVX06_02300 [Enterococcus faecium]
MNPFLLLLYPITFYCTELLKKLIDKNPLFFDIKRAFDKAFDIYQFIFYSFFVDKNIRKRL